MVAESVRACVTRDDPASLAEALRRARPALQLSREEIESCLDPKHFVDVRNVAGGPAPQQTSAALDRARTEQDNIDTWIVFTEGTLDAARAAVTRNL